MGTKSKFFRCFVEGNTISDGRKISAEMIDEIVATFNRDTYTPRINVEHLKGFSPEPPFNGYGDVFAVKAQTDTITVGGKAEQRRALYAQVDANDQLVALGAADQKPFPSVELTDSYAGTGKIGLVGLAFTDSPASIATQRLSFSRRAPGTVFAQGEEAPALEFEQAPADPTKVDGAIAGFFNALAAKFKTAEPEKPKDEPKQPANDNGFDVAAFTTGLQGAVSQSIAAAVKPITDVLTPLQVEFAAMKTRLEGTEQPGFSRAPATGAQVDAKFATDC